MAAQRFSGAKQGVFLTAAFGINNVMAEGLLRAPPGAFKAKFNAVPSHFCPTYLLLENVGMRNSIQFVRAIEALPHGHVAIGTHLPADGLFGSHEEEALTDLNEHVRYVHTKFMVIDPLGDDPMLVTGSANFSSASTVSNDENMLFFRGESARRLAEVYLVEFMRLHRHFAWRGRVVRQAQRGGSLKNETDEGEASSSAVPSPAACEDRLYLDCQFEDKDVVKALGARFDWQEQRWFVQPTCEQTLRRWGAKLVAKWQRDEPAAGDTSQMRPTTAANHTALPEKSSSVAGEAASSSVAGAAHETSPPSPHYCASWLGPHLRATSRQSVERKLFLGQPFPTMLNV